MVFVTWPNTKSQPQTSTRNLNPKPQPETSTQNLIPETWEREREFIGINIKQFHAKTKLRRWDTEKKLQNRLSRREPLESFINFYHGLKLMAELVRIK